MSAWHAKSKPELRKNDLARRFVNLKACFYQELADAKRSMVASFALSLESPAQLLNLSLTQWRYKLPANYWDRYAERVMAVTKDQIQAAARKYLAQDRMQVVVVGDPARALDPLKKLGPVETYDENGQPAAF